MPRGDKSKYTDKQKRKAETGAAAGKADRQPTASAYVVWQTDRRGA